MFIMSIRDHGPGIAGCVEPYLGRLAGGRVRLYRNCFRTN
jgi:hypothetical protein